jgi:hypothetical protein
VQLSLQSLLVCSQECSLFAARLPLHYAFYLFGSMHADTVLHLRLLRPPPTLAPLGGGRCAAVGVGVAWQRACVWVCGVAVSASGAWGYSGRICKLSRQPQSVTATC